MMILAFFVLLVLFFVQRSTSRNEEMGSSVLMKLVFLLMGVAFLLLETKSVIQFSLLFGTTWYNNSLVFLGILLLILAANWLAQFFSGRAALWGAYVLLVLFCTVSLYFPLANLLYVQNYFLRFISASLLTFSPIFAANLIFSIAFRNQKVAEHLFGWNLIGATIGGVLEYASMALGYNTLATLVLICYTVVFLLLLADSRFRVREAVKPQRVSSY